LATEAIVAPLAQAPVVIAVDVGGSSIKGALVGADAVVLTTDAVDTPQQSEAALVEAVVAVARRLADRALGLGVPAAALGVAAAGVIDESTGIARHGANLLWRDTALARRLEERIALPTALIQDARAAAHAEAIFGAGRNSDSFLAVILGTGVGSAVVMDGRPLRGAHGLAGEIGHLQVDTHRLICGCGGRGCIETVASASALSRRFAAATGQRIPAEAVVDQMLAGNPIATRLWADAVAALATAVAAAVAVVDCGLVIFGGGMTAAGERLLAPLRKALAQRLSLGPAPELVVAALGSAAGVLGAAAGALAVLGRDDVVDSWRSSPIPKLPAVAPSSADAGRSCSS
jgi:glucokinase